MGDTIYKDLKVNTQERDRQRHTERYIHTEIENIYCTYYPAMHGCILPFSLFIFQGTDPTNYFNDYISFKDADEHIY